jgi:hypothetical protein
MSRRLEVLLVAAALASAGAARAQIATRPLMLAPSRAEAVAASLPVKAPAGADRPAADLADPLDPLAPTLVHARSMESEVFAKTAIDRRFGRRDDITGSVGFLCGLQPGHNQSGGAAAYGFDPHGRFVGAKLSFAFR